MLWWHVMTGRILQKSPEANSYNQNPHGYKQGLKTQPGSQEKNSGSNQNICQGGIAPQFSNNPGRGLFVKILEGKRIMSCFVIMKTETHDQGCKEQAGIGWK